MFRPCIDLHDGVVKQIVGGTLTDDLGGLRTNFTANQDAAWFADLYRRDGLKGGHVIQLGAGNREAAIRALTAYPGGLQVGGGITPDNAMEFLEAGASHVIVTSWLFEGSRLSREKLDELHDCVGADRLVIDLSCRKRNGQYHVVSNRWQTFTDVVINEDTLHELSGYCDEFLIHGVDVEGLCQGIDLELVRLIASICCKPVTYAGGARTMDDLRTVSEVGQGRVHLTIGSALDIFGGNGVRYEEAVAFNRLISKQA